MTTLDHQLIALSRVRTSLSHLATILLAVVAAVLWGLGYGTAVTARGFIRAGLWSAAAVTEGWRDVWPPGGGR